MFPGCSSHSHELNVSEMESILAQMKTWNKVCLILIVLVTPGLAFITSDRKVMVWLNR